MYFEILKRAELCTEEDVSSLEKVFQIAGLESIMPTVASFCCWYGEDAQKKREMREIKKHFSGLSPESFGETIVEDLVKAEGILSGVKNSCIEKYDRVTKVTASLFQEQGIADSREFYSLRDTSCFFCFAVDILLRMAEPKEKRRDRIAEGLAAAIYAKHQAQE